MERGPEALDLQIVSGVGWVRKANERPTSNFQHPTRNATCERPRESADAGSVTGEAALSCQFFIFVGGLGRRGHSCSIYSKDVQKGDFPAWRSNFRGKMFFKGYGLAWVKLMLGTPMNWGVNEMEMAVDSFCSDEVEPVRLSGRQLDACSVIADRK